MIFVDDGSRDETLRVLESLRAEVGEVAVVLPKRPNGGKAEAVRFGMNYAISELGAEVTGFWDADLATPLDAVPELLAILEQEPRIQMVFGARVKLLGRRIERRVTRHYLGRVFATVVSNVLQLPVYDTQCGAKLFRVTGDFGAVLRERFISRWIFDVEIIARFIQRRGVGWVHDAIYEYPLQQWEDVAGSKVKSGDFFKAAGEILAIWNRYLRGRA
jgi:glycosyltransferase involved in cell wall biosynthesis